MQVKYYGCVKCQAEHKEYEPLYTGHIDHQSKHGIQSRYEYVPTVELCKMTKRALVGLGIFSKVSVTRGRGTASGWVNADVEITAPEDCFCTSDSTRCPRCIEQLRFARGKADEATKNIPYHTWTSDDGYDTERDECIIQVRLIPLLDENI